MLPPSRRELMFQSSGPPQSSLCYREMSDLPKPYRAPPTGQQQGAEPARTWDTLPWSTSADRGTDAHVHPYLVPAPGPLVIAGI